MHEFSHAVRPSALRRALPALSLILLAPLIAEVLPGATRLSAIFVFPIEVLIWGGGAVLIREAVRRYSLGWRNLLLLALALSLAEELLIQQTSLASVVVKLKGVEYARFAGVNYVYLVWAAIYEVLFVVVVPIGLAELIFRNRRREPWLTRAGAVTIAILFLPACFFAWFTWTKIARTKVFHLEEYHPPTWHFVIAVGVIGFLIAAALGPWRRRLGTPSSPLKPPRPWALFLFGCLITVCVFALEVLAFGIQPAFPATLAVAIGLGVAALLVALVPRWVAHRNWTDRSQIALLYGAIFTNMAIFFIAFVGASSLDLYGKIVIDVVAAILLLRLAASRR
jgi:hypothetical protein